MGSHASATLSTLSMHINLPVLEESHGSDTESENSDTDSPDLEQDAGKEVCLPTLEKTP